MGVVARWMGGGGGVAAGELASAGSRCHGCTTVLAALLLRCSRYAWYSPGVTENGRLDRTSHFV